MAVKMLASRAAQALGDIVTEQLKPFAEDPLKQAFTSITGIPLNDPNQEDLKKLQHELGQISNQLVSINNGISNLVSVVDERFFGVKEDLLWSTTNSINTAWESYVEMVQNYNNPKAGKTVASIRKSLINLLQGHVDKVPEQMNTIHHYLVDGDNNSLIAQACKVQRGKSKDIITFYVTMKNYLRNFLLVQAKGVALLNIMQMDPDINIGNAQQVIDKLKPRLAAQENWLREKFGIHTYDLVTRLLGTQGHKIETWFAYNDNQPICLFRVKSNGTHYYSEMTAATDNPWKHWKIMPVDCDLETVESTTDYQFQLTYDHSSSEGFGIPGEYGLGWFTGSPTSSSPETRKPGVGPADQIHHNAWVLIPMENDFVQLRYKKRNGGKDGISYLYRWKDAKFDSFWCREGGDTRTSNQNFQLWAVGT